MTVLDPEKLNARAATLDDQGLNGLDFALVTALDSTTDPGEAHLQLHFHNAHGLAAILAAASAENAFQVYGGQRVRAGPTGEVAVRSAAAGSGPTVLDLVVAPIGDYSTYTLEVEGPAIDPLFAEVQFKFRPGCFSTLCDPDWAPGIPRPREPAIDYLAKDYESFRHTLMAAMETRVPGWRPSSEVDLSQVLLSLFSVAADELSDYQDRVMNEAYFGSARNRVSLARHARLMDYHIHQGNQAETWLAVRLKTGQESTLYGLEVWTGGPEKDPDSVVFLSRGEQKMHALLNDMELYDWGGAQYALEAGSTSADLKFSAESHAKKVAELIRAGDIPYLLVQEHLDPVTGRDVGFYAPKRQLLKLRRGSVDPTKRPQALKDPVGYPPPADPSGTKKYYWYVRVHWVKEDALENDFCFTKTFEHENRTVPHISLFHGNLIRLYHGAYRRVVFKPPTERLTSDEELHYETTNRQAEGDPKEEEGRWGTLCRLPSDEPLLYRDTAPRSAEEPQSTLEARHPVEWHEPPEGDPDAADESEDDGDERPQGRVMVKTVDATGEQADPWTEVITLVNSDEDDDHFAVETDEQTRSVIRFGNGTNGRGLPDGATVECWYQTGLGPEGNIGADSLVNFAPVARTHSLAEVEEVWNPFDVTGGRAPEPHAEILRSVPEAFNARQLRAVTLKDYVRRAEEVTGVSGATATYGWTGSWRSVRVTVDPVGTEVLEPDLRREIAEHLDVVRLIGDDLEIRGPRLVPLEIVVRLCVRADVWLQDVRAVLEQEFSDGYTPDGRLGFFHPDEWTFGQPLRKSQILGRVHSVAGVDHVLSVTMRRKESPDPTPVELVEVSPTEVVQVRNDRDHMERGHIFFDVQGGRR